MEFIKNKANYFSSKELILWGTSAFFIILSFFIFDGSGYLTLIASLIGVTSLIFNAKGNPVGQFLMIIFSMIYGYISYGFSYYGEMLTYIGMTLPMALFSLISWIKNPYKGNKSEVEVNTLKTKEYFFMLALTILVTFVFYRILVYFNTANIVPSTVSVATSFGAVYLTFRRSPYFALCYGANDLVLIVLWILASAQNKEYISVVICFAVFFVNDIYGFANWQKMKKKQNM